jgi:hypothetical protein
VLAQGSVPEPDSILLGLAALLAIAFTRAAQTRLSGGAKGNGHSGSCRLDRAKSPASTDHRAVASARPAPSAAASVTA